MCSLSNIKVGAVQKQRVGSGLLSKANAVGENPSQILYDQAIMRSHLERCLAAKKVQLFPKVILYCCLCMYFNKLSVYCYSLLVCCIYVLYILE